MAERRFYQGETFANYDPGELLENAEFEEMCIRDRCGVAFIKSGIVLNINI